MPRAPLRVGRALALAGTLAAQVACGAPPDGAPPVDAAALDAPDAVDGPGPAPAANILLLIGDDIGLDASVCHDLVADPGRAPRLRALCGRGVVFDNVWAAPLCSPTRATILTGRHGFRTTVGTVGNPLPVGERALPRALLDGNPAFAVAAAGKWHLANATNGGADHPNLVGFSHYAGSLAAQVPDYWAWPRVVDGVTAQATEYATTVNVNDARDWIAAQTRPWMMWLAFNAAHTPVHVPPAGLHTYTGLAGPPLPPRPVDHYHAMIEAMDTEVGRLLDGLAPEVLARTWIIFVGDNGTPGNVTQPPVSPTRAKGTLYQGGVQVPLVIAGPGVVGPGRRVAALAHTADLFRTVLELAQVDPLRALPPGGNTVDSVSLVPYLEQVNAIPQRSWVMTEVFGGAPIGGGRPGKAIRDDAFKLIRFDAGDVELYDLRVDPRESNNLVAAGPLPPEAAAHRASLTAALDTLLASP